MKKIDYHIHGSFSYDSQVAYNQLIEKAISLHYSSIAFTEHLDLLPQELGVIGLNSLTHYITQITTLRTTYSDIEILCGLEVGDFHQVQAIANSLLDMYPMDIVLGSVHFLSDHTNVAVPLAAKLSNNQLTDYYRQNLKLVTECKIDVLAHLGVFSRYYSEQVVDSEHYPIIRDIFQAMIDKGIALEINYSAYRKMLQELIPSRELMDYYSELGGRLISIGSDSHQLKHFDDHYCEIEKQIDFSRFDLIAPTAKKYF
ncbi:MAG: histidinol phosphatase [Candidatus Cloacimonetes bacterium HGW-Cloacimonetes-1]|jgi:histidinol-phosphatase (PHP family)|nr:MAG: histidinol phosphatase [Candidatus Cloacimonetes bacterium HGW-Cloacimonetes-1]